MTVSKYHPMLTDVRMRVESEVKFARATSTPSARKNAARAAVRILLSRMVSNGEITDFEFDIGVHGGVMTGFVRFRAWGRDFTVTPSVWWNDNLETMKAAIDGDGT